MNNLPIRFAIVLVVAFAFLTERSFSTVISFSEADIVALFEEAEDTLLDEVLLTLGVDAFADDDDSPTPTSTGDDDDDDDGTRLSRTEADGSQRGS